MITSTTNSKSNNNNNNNNIVSNNGSGSKLFHTYENVGYDDQQLANMANSTNIVPSSPLSTSLSNIAPNIASNNNIATGASNGLGSYVAGPASALSSVPTSGGAVGGSVAKNITAIESPFADPTIHDALSPATAQPSNITTNPAVAATASSATTKILSTTDSTGTTRMLTTAARTPPVGQQTNLVTKLITFPSQSSMDSLKEWSVSTFKCTKQLINEKRGICPVTSDLQLQNDIEQLRENRNKLVQMLRYGQQMTSHYTQLVKTQKQLHSLMNEMSIKCFTSNNNNNTNINNNGSNHHSSINSNGNSSLNSYTSGKHSSSKQVVANFSSLGNNLSSSTTTTSPTHHQLNHHHSHSASSASSNNASAISLDHNNFENFLPVLNYMRNTNLSLVDDFKKNAMTLNVAIKNGEKLIAALNFYCSSLATLIDKTIEDTLITVKQYESARLEYDAEKNSLNFMSPSAQTSITYSSDKLELARMRFEQSREDVQIKMKFLEENTIRVMHKQLLIFNGAFASYTSGNTAALDATLKHFSIRDSTSG